jgi:superfamily II DNA or RNA helicase
MSLRDEFSPPSVFEAFRRGTKAVAVRPPPPRFCFQLLPLNGRVILRVVDGRGNPVNVDYRGVHGALREVLRHMDEVRESDQFRIDWEDVDAADEFYVDEHPVLLGYLPLCENLVSASMKPVVFEAHARRLELSLESEGGFLRGRFRLVDEQGNVTLVEDLLLLGSMHLLLGDRIVPLQPVGEYHRQLRLFGDRIGSFQMAEFLSLFFSSFRSVGFRMEGYRVQEASPLTAGVALFFRKVDDQQSLHLDLVSHLPGLSHEFIRDYELTRLARVDEQEHLVEVRELIYGDDEGGRSRLLKLVKACAKTLSAEGKEAFFAEPEAGRWILGAELAEHFLQKHLSELALDFVLLGAEKLTPYKVRHVRPVLKLGLRHGIHFLEGDASLQLEGETFALFDALQRYRTHSFVELSDGTRAILDASYMDRLQRLFKKKDKGVQVSFFDLPLLEDLIAKGDESVASLPGRAFFDGFNGIREREVALPKIKAVLRPYQMDGVRWLDYLFEHRIGGCLADDMGLGKTLMVICLLSRVLKKRSKPCLVVMPRSLIFNWEAELKRFCPSISHCIHHGSGRNLEEALKHQVILTTYGTLRAEVERFAEHDYLAVILDESQAIKNQQSQVSQAVLTLKAEFRLAMSGTPIENHLGELFTLFRFLNPSMFSNAAAFDRDYLQPIQNRGDADAAAELRRKVYPFILRRRKEEVLKDLPPKVEQVIEVEMGEAQKRLYEGRRKFYEAMVSGEIQQHGLAKSQFLVLEAMMELRQIAAFPEIKSEGLVESAKLQVLDDLLTEAIENGRKCLVFSNFLGGVDRVGTLLESRSIGYLTITGATSNRQSIVDRFQSDPMTKVLVMTLKTGGVGLNLTAADTVFILDPWWNTAAEAQAVDRTHRIGQQSTVFAYRIISKGSIEEKILQLQQHKRAIADQVLSNDESAFKSLSESDVAYLLGD